MDKELKQIIDKLIEYNGRTGYNLNRLEDYISNMPKHPYASIKKKRIGFHEIYIKEGFCRSLMRDILRYDGVNYGEVDEICKMIPNDPKELNLYKISADIHFYLRGSKEGKKYIKTSKELLEKVKKYQKSFEFGCLMEYKIWRILKPNEEIQIVRKEHDRRKQN